MGKLKTIDLMASQRAALEQGYREGPTQAFRLRCQMILLKSTARASAEIADLLGCCEVVVNNWLKRYEAEGIAGLRTKSGRGRKPILDAEQDFARVKEVVKAHRQIQPWFNLSLFGYLVPFNYIIRRHAAQHSQRRRDQGHAKYNTRRRLSCEQWAHNCANTKQLVRVLRYVRPIRYAFYAGVISS